MIIKNILTRYLFLALALILFILPFAGCATMLAGSNQIINVDSNVPGAKVVFNGHPVGVTPISLPVPKQKESTLLITKKGYQPQTIMMETEMTGSFFIDFLWGIPGLTSTTVDLMQNSAYKYAPNSYFINLIPEQASQLELDSLMAEANLRRFILYNYTHIVRDSSMEQGEYLEALSGLLSVKTIAEKSELAKELLDLHEDDPSSPVFAERILAYSKREFPLLRYGGEFR